MNVLVSLCFKKGFYLIFILVAKHSPRVFMVLYSHTQQILPFVWSRRSELSAATGNISKSQWQ